MTRKTLCNLTNLLFVLVIWAGLANIPWVWIKMYSVWLNVLWYVVSLVVAGYVVQYFVSRWVNRIFFKNSIGE
jgi:hypothetical protein